MQELVLRCALVLQARGFQKEKQLMSKLTANDFKLTGIVSITDDPSFKNVKAKYVVNEKLKIKLPEAVLKLYAKEKARRKFPNAWVLKVKHKEHTAYAIVTGIDISTNQVRVVDKHGKTITKAKQAKFDSIGE
jgi:hypothetical protein